MKKWWWNVKLWFRIRRASALATDMHYLAHVAWWNGDNEASKEFHKTALYIESVEKDLQSLWWGEQERVPHSREKQVVENK